MLLNRGICTFLVGPNFDRRTLAQQLDLKREEMLVKSLILYSEIEDSCVPHKGVVTLLLLCSTVCCLGQIHVYY